MSGNFYTIQQTLVADVADAGTFTVAYPAGLDAGAFTGGFDHKVVSNVYGVLEATMGEVSFSFGTSNITVTNNSGGTLRAGTEVYVELDQAGANDDNVELANREKMAIGSMVKINLGAPDAADPNGIFESYTGDTPALDGALVSGGVATFDVPRNIVVDSGGADTAVLTFTGTDEYGNTVVESITLNGTTAVAGKKAFKTVTGVTSSASIANGAFAGTGDVLGLPVFLPNVGDVVVELEDGSAASSGTVVAGVSTAATATTGDVRGTYDPNSAADGAKSFQLVAWIGDLDYKGVAQFAG